MSKQENTHPNQAAERKISRHLTIVKARNRRIILIAVSLCLILVLVACAMTFLHLTLQKPNDDGKILENVTVGGINIGGMTPVDAKNAILLTLEPGLRTKDMVVRLDNDTLVISPEDANISLDVDDLVEAAYLYGRSGSNFQNNLTRMQAKSKVYTIALLPYMVIDLNHVLNTVEDFCASYNISMVPPKVTLNGQRPAYPLSQNSDLTAPATPTDSQTAVIPGASQRAVEHQILTITMGSPESYLDPKELYYAILDGYSLYDLEIFYEPPVLVDPEKPDAQAIFDQYCVYPQDATIDNKTFNVTPEVYGYGFNVAALQSLIDRADYGETIQISLDFLLPDITAEALAGGLFQDKLAVYTSLCKDSANKNRDKNLQASCAAINGYVIKVGESFDLNQILGPRTTERGYYSAPSYSGSTTSTIGGGISQTASALYYCALLSGLQIDEHHYHRYAVEYSPMGTDASITYGSENLVFTNNTSAPIRILAEANGSTVKITFLGTEDKPHLLSIESYTLNQSNPNIIYQSMVKNNELGYKDGDVIQTGLTGYEIQTYLCKYDPTTGELISRELLDTVIYDRRDQIVVRIHSDNDI